MITKKITHFILLPGIILMLIQSCKKNPETPEIPNAAFSKQALEYVQLTPGKYLIYKDSATSVLDSVIIIKSELTKIFVPEDNRRIPVVCAHNEEHFELKLFSTTTNSEWLTGNAQTRFNFICKNDDSLSVDMFAPDGMSVALIPYNVQSNLTITVEGSIYHNVFVNESFNSTDINYTLYKKTIIYWVKGIGIIKKTLITTGGAIKTTFLIRHN